MLFNEIGLLCLVDDENELSLVVDEYLILLMNMSHHTKLLEDKTQSIDEQDVSQYFPDGDAQHGDGHVGAR